MQLTRIPMTANHPTLLRGLHFPVGSTVVPVTVRAAHFLPDLYAQLRCSMVEVVALAPGAALWCDEEALLKQPVELNRVWRVDRGGQSCNLPLSGGVIALGTDADGEARSLTFTDACEALGRLVGAFQPNLARDDRSLSPTALQAWVNSGVDWTVDPHAV